MRLERAGLIFSPSLAGLNQLHKWEHACPVMAVQHVLHQYSLACRYRLCSAVPNATKCVNAYWVDSNLSTLLLHTLRVSSPGSLELLRESCITGPVNCKALKPEHALSLALQQPIPCLPRTIHHPSCTVGGRRGSNLRSSVCGIRMQVELTLIFPPLPVKAEDLTLKPLAAAGFNFLRPSCSCIRIVGTKEQGSDGIVRSYDRDELIPFWQSLRDSQSYVPEETRL